MRRSRLSAVTGAAALVGAAVLGASAATAAPASGSMTSLAAATSGNGSFIVLAKEGADVQALADQLAASGAQVTSVNKAVGMVSVARVDASFGAAAKQLDAVEGVAKEQAIGHSPKEKVAEEAVLKENAADSSRKRGSDSRWPRGKGSNGEQDPMDPMLWDMQMMQVPEAQKVTLGDKRVKVGIIDTGVDGTHPDIAPNFDNKLSRNFTTDMVDVDGECEVASCVDPANVDENGHGTHVAGTIGASLNGSGMSGVAPKVGLVNVRAGQDSGYFFVGPTVNALTYAGDAGLDVVNMSFYVDPWLYNCKGGAPEDTPEQAAEQDTIIKVVRRALNYAHNRNVTLVAALGNDHDNIDDPRDDTSSPDYGADPHLRTIDPSKCYDLPVQGPHVIGVSSVGPSKKKADYSNWAGNLRSGSLEVSAPGGWFRDGFGTDTYRTNENLILSAYPLNVAQAEGAVDADGNVTPAGEAAGVKKD